MKRIISILLAITLVASCTVATSALYSWFDEQVITVDQAIQNYIQEGNEAPETYRYYFLMPDGTNGDLGDDESQPSFGKFAENWYKTYADGTPATNTAGIYWWDSKVADPEGWIGYLPSGVEECDSAVYYADVPVAVTGIIWNNGIDGGMDPENPIYYCSAQSINIPCEYYDAGESDNYPDGTDNFDNMIFVIDPDLVSVNDLSGMQTCGGEWYYYYGHGCYGFTANGNETNCLRDDHFDANGNHVGKHNSQPSTQAPSTQAPSTQTPSTQAPSEPTYKPGDFIGILGDADRDSYVSIMDATEIQLIVADLKQATQTATILADADRDGDVSIMDATELQLYVAGLSNSDAIGDNIYKEPDPIKCDKCNTTVTNPYSYGSYDELCYSCYSSLKNTKYCDMCYATVTNPYSYGSYDELCYSCYTSLKNTKYCDKCYNATSYTYSYGSYDELCYSCYKSMTSTNSCEDCGTYVSSPYYYNGYRLCYDCYYDRKYSSTSCDYCGTYVSSPYYYNGYDLCYSCYYDIKYSSTRCDDCGTSVSSPYYYNGYELCYSCYYDRKYSSTKYCDNCYTSVSSPYYYDGYELCYSCYNSLKNAKKCFYCGDRMSSYKYIVVSGIYREVCYSCYYDKMY